MAAEFSPVGRISVAHPAAIRWMRYAYPPYATRKQEFRRPDKRSASGDYAVDALCLSTLPYIYFLNLTASTPSGEEFRRPDKRSASGG